MVINKKPSNPSILSIVSVVMLAATASGQVCENGVKVSGKSCCECEAGFAPPDCSRCLDGYLLGVDTSGKKICYNGVTNCHNDLPAPFGCGGRGTCSTCPPGDALCKPICECKPGFFGDKCDQALSSGCQPESVHMYTVFPQRPVSGENFSVILWGCNINGASQYKIVPENTSCAANIDIDCDGQAGYEFSLKYNKSETADSGQCNSCGECSTSSDWSLSDSTTGCSSTVMISSVESTLSNCMSKCHQTGGCKTITYDCKTGSCELFETCQTGSQLPNSDLSRWSLPNTATPSPNIGLPPVIKNPVSANGIQCFGKDASSCLVSFEMAQQTCQSDSKRLCTISELESDICCSTAGCEESRHAIWTSDSASNCPAMAQSMNGCPQKGSIKDAQRCESVKRTRRVACCTNDVVGRCYAMKGDQSACYGDASTYAEAQQICQSDGKRLCTPTEVHSGTCCGKGCGTSDSNIWIASTSSDPSNKCTDDQLAGVQPQSFGTQLSACSSSSSQQCVDKTSGLGGIRCCDDVTMGQGAAGFGGKNCKKSSAKVKGSVVQNKKTGCHTIRSRDDSISRESVRFVSPLSGTCTDSTCGCKGCLDGTTCPTCSTAIELCNRPGSFLQLKGNVLSFSPAPENFCNTYTTESPCTANPTCLWESNMCKQQSVVDFMLETTFSVVPSKDFTGFLTIIKNEMTVVPDSRGLTVTESVAAPASASSWKLEVAMSKSSTEASIPLINIEVPQGGIEYKICQRPEGTKTWMELQTHTQQGYRTPTFLVAGTLNDAADGEGRGAASADDHCHDAPIWWLILLILLLCLCIALLAAKKYRNEGESERNNKRYSDFDVEDDEFDSIPLENKEQEPEC